MNHSPAATAQPVSVIAAITTETAHMTVNRKSGGRRDWPGRDDRHERDGQKGHDEFGIH